MKLEQNSDKNIYIQLADWIEDNVLSGLFPEEGRIPSVAELSVSFKINHITTLKSINALTENGIIYKKNGVGMFVSKGAREIIRNKRKEAFYSKYIAPAVKEAEKLGVTYEELNEMIRREIKDEHNDN